VTGIPISAVDRESFYGAAVLGLRALDARERSPRRFGAEADARWAQFAGALGLGDRVDILLRDAAGTWGTAFSPAECFGFFGLADDEPFGPDWSGLPDHAAKKVLVDFNRVPNIDDVAQALGVKVSSVPTPSLTPATKIAVAGDSALVTIARAFGADSSLSWTDQVVAIASKGSSRQLAGLAAVVLGARGRTAVIRPGREAAAALRAAGFSHVDIAVVSSDAEPEAGEVARAAGGK
jgi:hypothetical protein